MPPPPLLAGVAAKAGAVIVPTGSILGQLAVFFQKAGSLTFGSGLVIVPFLEKGLVQQTGWLSGQQFLVAVAMGMLSPGPVVITATFVGYVVTGFWGSLLSTIGIFLPSFLLVLMVAPILIRHREHPNIQGFVKGAYAAAIGAILGAGVLLGRIAIEDWLTALIGVMGMVALGPLEGQQSAVGGHHRGDWVDRIPTAQTHVGLCEMRGGRGRCPLGVCPRNDMEWS
ncbi:MAG TPA: chromate transporter [bacterium]|nr:chromate transporter [bacterium]